MTTTKYFKSQDFDGDWHTHMYTFYPNKDVARLQWEDVSMYELVNKGFIQIDYWEFGAINNGITVDEFKKRQAKAWADRVKNGD